MLTVQSWPISRLRCRIRTPRGFGHPPTSFAISSSVRGTKLVPKDGGITVASVTVGRDQAPRKSHEKGSRNRRDKSKDSDHRKNE